LLVPFLIKVADEGKVEDKVPKVEEHKVGD
jgi:hypothetical protein